MSWIFTRQARAFHTERLRLTSSGDGTTWTKGDLFINEIDDCFSSSEALGRGTNVLRRTFTYYLASEMENLEIEEISNRHTRNVSAGMQ